MKLYLKTIRKITSSYLDYDYNININSKLQILNKTESNEYLLYKELLRKKIIDNLIKIFINEIKKLKTIHKNINLYNILKYNKINELIQKWCWLQYYNNTICDVVIPYVLNEKYNYDNLINDINYILNLKINYDNKIIINLNNKVKKYLKSSYNKYLKLISDTKNLNKNIKILLIKNKDDIIFTLYSESNSKLLSFNTNIDLYNRLYNKFIHTNLKSKLDPNIFIFSLLYRYSYIDSGNQQLAIDKTIKYLFAKIGVDFELYGSAINVISNYYCSLFYDIEKYFGSQGNFFDIELKQGIYWCNPPYDDSIMTNTAIKLIKILEIYKNIAFIITIPIWDKKTQYHKLEYVTKNYNINTHSNDHKDYKIYSLLKPYIKAEILIPKKRIPYFNYRLNRYIYAVDTYMLIVYNNIDNLYVKSLHDIFDLIIKLDKKNYFIV